MPAARNFWDYQTDAYTRPRYNVSDNLDAMARALGVSREQVQQIALRGVDPTAQLQYRQQLAQQMAQSLNQLFPQNDPSQSQFTPYPQWNPQDAARQWDSFKNNMTSVMDLPGGIDSVKAAADSMMKGYDPYFSKIGTGIDAQTAAGAGAAAGGGYYSAIRESKLAQQQAALRAQQESALMSSLNNKANAINSMYGGLIGTYAGGDVQQRNLAATQFYDMQRLNQQAMNAARMGAMSAILNGAYNNATDFQGGAGILARLTNPYYLEPTTPYPGAGGGNGMAGFGNGMPSGFGMGNLSPHQSPNQSPGQDVGSGQSAAAPNTTSSGFYNGYSGYANNTAGALYDNYQAPRSDVYQGSNLTSTGVSNPYGYTTSAYTTQ